MLYGPLTILKESLNPKAFQTCPNLSGQLPKALLTSVELLRVKGHYGLSSEDAEALFPAFFWFGSKTESTSAFKVFLRRGQCSEVLS